MEYNIDNPKVIKLNLTYPIYDNDVVTNYLMSNNDPLFGLTTEQVQAKIDNQTAVLNFKINLANSDY